MRKYIRNIIRSYAEKNGDKASRVVRATFNELQIKKYGAKRRLINQRIGTHKLKLWESRISNIT